MWKSKGTRITKIILKKNKISQAWCIIPIVPAFKSLRQKDHRFEVSLGNIVSLSQTKQNLKKNKNQEKG
jgi:hypothetical protein